MSAAKRDRLSVKDRFIRRLENQILSGELAVGQRLPSERELARQMDISKTAVHDGITEMVHKGFLDVVPRQGIFVGDYARSGTLNALESIMRYDGGQLDRRNITSLLEMRSAVEGLALERVIQRGDPEVVRELKGILDQAEAIAARAGAGEDRLTVRRELSECCFRFHHAICVASGNTIAPLIFNAFREPSVAIWEQSVDIFGVDQSVARLRPFFQVIQKRDLTAARAHLDFITRTSLGTEGMS